ncbi:iron complex outermembrane receptor protein [Pseudoduganella lurida]|uniref:Iron complex outermembrane receptor protein n=1 Tax=Pseudoduganella lurida TaxID=1036180 RepID=A0A562RN00_9BURK|nr:TonB-dependent receptor [Pseudoduganella lurida]TWI69806.1 iron complex outermembrane receptor protein [Pseudoduganella lurida]
MISIQKAVPRPMAIAVAVAMLTLGVAGAARAQAAQSAQAAVQPDTPADAPAAGLETVVVTANKRVEKLENVPMSISVISEELLRRNNVRDLEDIIDLSPALTKTQSDNPANTGLNMRGIGTQSIGIGVESDVAVIVDDIPIGMQVQAFRDLTDVSRVEILKGPQSTLFGKSAIAGAINIVTRPISGPITTRASVLASSDREWRLGLSVGGEVNEKFGFRIAASNTDFPGNVNNLTTGKKTNGSGGKTFLVKLAWRPLENVSIDFSPRYNHTLTDCCVVVLNGISGTNLQNGLLNNVPAFPIAQVLDGISATPDNRNIRNDTFTGQDSTTRGMGLRVNWELPNGATLTSITSTDRYHANDSRDQDFTDRPVMLYYPVSGTGRPAGLPGGSEQHGRFDVVSRTQEIRLTSADSEAFRYVVGLWYGKNELARYFKRGENGVTATSATEFYGDTYNINKAVFGQASWEFMPKNTLTAGLRYNEQESGYHFAGTGNPSTLPFGSGFKAVNNFSSTGNTDEAVTGKLSLQRQFTPGLMAYAMASTGYKGHAYDITSSLNALTAAQQPVKPETARSFEIGAKGNFLNNRLAVAATLFSSKFKDYQQNSGSYIPDTLIYQTRLNSLPGVETKGAELDINAMVTPNLLVNAFLAYTDATITEFRNAQCYQVSGGGNGGFNAGCILRNPLYGNQNTNDVSGGRMPYAPRRKASINAKYDVRLPSQSFDAFVTGTVNYASDMVTNLDQNPINYVQPTTYVNAGFGFQEKSGRASLTFRVNNLTDKQYMSNRSVQLANFNASAPNAPASVTTTTWTPLRNAFRSVAVKLDVKF